MKKFFCVVTLLLALLPSLSACNQTDYSAYVSEARSDLFLAQTDEFSVTVACVSREYPYLADGVPNELSKVVEINLRDFQGADGYSIFLGSDRSFGGEMSFRNVQGDYFFSQGVKAFPTHTLTLVVEWGEERREIAATSVKNEHTMSVNTALEKAISAHKERIDGMTQNGVFCGEFYVRLLRRESNYYYVGIIDKTGRTLSLLLDGESGEILAHRESE